MLYQKPFDQTDPNAGYVNGNPGAGIAGSIPPAAAIEQPMREIVYAITASGQTPSTTDLTQLWKAIQASGGTYVNSLSITGGRLFFTASSTSFTFPAGTKNVRVIGQAGGGGGGAGNNYAGAGGLGGNSFEGVFDITAGTPYTLNVGIGGAGAAPGSSPGGNGGLTSFGPQGSAALATAFGGTGGASGGNASTSNVGFTGSPPGIATIAFPHGGYQLAGGGAQNGIILPTTPNVNIGGIGGGSRFSSLSPNPYGNGHFDANGYGGGGSGGAGSDPGGAGAGGLLILEY